MAGTDVRQLILQVDASVAVAQRNLQSLARSVEQGSTQMDASLGKVDRAFSRVGKSAQDSANVFLEGDRAAKRLIASIDPLYAAQLRYNDAIEEAQRLNKQGTLDAQELARVQAGLKAQLDQSTQGMGRAAGVAGSMRSGLQQLSFQVGDVAQGFALGVRPMTIFAQQSGQVVQAFQLMGSSGNKFLAFLAGPWGLAISSAATVLLLLVSKMGEAEDATGGLVKKMREQAEQARLNELANMAWERTLPGLIEKHKELNDTLRQQIETDRERLHAQLDNARADNSRVRSERSRLQRELAAARRELDEATAGLSQANPGGRYESALGLNRKRYDEAQKAVEALAREFNEATLAAAETSESVENLTVLAARADASAIVDPIKARFEQMRRVAEATIKDVDTLAKRLAELDRQEQAAIKASQAREKNTLPKFTITDARSVVEGLGATVTSTGRTAAQNKKAGGGVNSYHLANRAIDFVPAGGMGSLTKEEIRAAFEAQGAKIVELLGPGDKGHDDHFHVAFSNTRLGPDQIAKAQEARANRGERDRMRGVRVENRFEEKLEQLDGQLLAAKMDLVDDVSKQAEYAAEMVRAEQDRLNLAIQNDVEEKKLTQAQADILKAKTEELAQQKLKNIEIRKQVDLIRQADEAMQDEYAYRLDQLKFQDEFARTQGQRRVLQLQILDLVYEEKRLHLEYLKAQAVLNKNTEEAARIQGEINRLPEYKAMDQARTERRTQSPMDAWADSVPQTAEEMAEAMEQLQVQGINGVIDSLVALQGGWKDMRDVAIAAIQDIIAQLIRMQLMKLALNLLGGAAGAGSATGGADVSGLYAGVDPMFLGGLTGAATGVSATIGGRGGTDNNVLSINGRPTLKVSSGEELIVLPKMPKVAMPSKASNDNASAGGIYHISVTAPNTGNPKADRRTAWQQAALIRSAVATVNKKGG